MGVSMPESRTPAPGVLGVLQEFMNSGHLASRAPIDPDVADAIRQRRARGESQATLASAYGLVQGLVAAIARGARIEDDIGTPELASVWLRERGLLPAGSMVDADGLVRLQELRELLRALAQANNGQPLDPEIPASLNAIAGGVTLSLRFDSNVRAAVETAETWPDLAIGRILVALFDAMRDGTFQRLKRCPGDGCPHTFYDTSRNRTGTWCSMAVCGNRTKVRAYQGRRRATRTV